MAKTTKKEVEELSPPEVAAPVKINLGSGPRKLSGYINIDNRPETEPDLLCDVTLGIPMPDNSVDEIRAHDFLEHIPMGQPVVTMMEEFYRILRPGGVLDTFTPDCEAGQGAYQDPFHKSLWCQNSWLYYTCPAHRALYGIRANFRLTTMERIASNGEMRIYHLRVVGNAIKEEVPNVA